MKFGLTPEQYNYIESNVVAPLQQKGAKVWCFGSRARGDYQKFSDLDLMVESPQDLSREISKIAECVSNSSFPFKVDIVQFSDFADSYKSSFNSDKVLFSSTSFA